MSEEKPFSGKGIAGVGIWGAHLNKSSVNNGNSISNLKKKPKIKIKDRTSTALSKGISGNTKSPSISSFSNTFLKPDSSLMDKDINSDNLSSISGPRLNLKKRKNGPSLNRSKSYNFFDTMGFGDDSLSQDSLANNSDNMSHDTSYGGKTAGGSTLGEKSKSDPLARFDPEISTDGFSCSELESSQIASAVDAHNQIPTTPSSASTSRPISFLGAINSSFGSTSDTRLSFGSRHFSTPLPGGGGAASHKRISNHGDGVLPPSGDGVSGSDKATKRMRDDSEYEETEDASINSTAESTMPLTKKYKGGDGISNRCYSGDLEDEVDMFGDECDNADNCFPGKIALPEQDTSDKENWSKVEERLNMTTKQDAYTQKGKIDLYSLGFEEEEDVKTAAEAASAGRTALLPLHHASNSLSTTSRTANTNMQKERLMNKVASGRANENYQKINLKKKVFVRGRAGRMTGPKYLRQEWKRKILIS